MAGFGAAVGTRSRGHGATRPRGLALVGVSGGRGRKPGLCSGSRGVGVGNPASAPRPGGRVAAGALRGCGGGAAAVGGPRAACGLGALHGCGGGAPRSEGGSAPRLRGLRLRLQLRGCGCRTCLGLSSGLGPGRKKKLKISKLKPNEGSEQVLI
jgi:hypothetical protein